MKTLVLLLFWRFSCIWAYVHWTTHLLLGFCSSPLPWTRPSTHA